MMERNITLDYFKIIISILVITIHVQPLFYPDSPLGWLISNGIARVAVPCFFIINGYFLGNKISNNKAVFNYIVKLIIIYLVWILIYSGGLADKELKMSLILFVFGYTHLWYVVALIIGTLLLFGINKIIKNKNKILLICTLLFFTGATIQTFMDINSVIDLFKTRNGLFVGLPFIFLGNYIRSYEEKLNKISNSIILVLLIVFTIVLLGESYYCLVTQAGKDLFFSLIMVCPLALIYILRISTYKADNGYIGQLASGIYFTHILAMVMVNIIFPQPEMKIYVLPLIIFLSLIISAVVIELNKRIKIFL